MGFFKKLFARESVADRIARAKQHVAEGDDALAIRVLINLDEPEALAICEAAQGRLRGNEPTTPDPEADDYDDYYDEDYDEASDSVITIENLRIQFYNVAVVNVMIDNAATIPIGDAGMMVVADVLGVAETSLTWRQIAKLGLSREDAVARARAASTAACLTEMQSVDVCVPGASGELLICNGFYMCGAMLNVMEQMPASEAYVVCPLTWHHWFVFTLAPEATADTLKAIRNCVDTIADSITTIRTAFAWVTRSLWWWPGGSNAPVVIDLDALPADLQQRLGPTSVAP